MRYSPLYREDMREACPGQDVIDSLSGKNILLTGASGLIGSAVADLLLFINQERRADIRIFLAGRKQERIERRFEEYKPEIDYKFVSYAFDKSLILPEKMDFVLHMAGIANTKMYSSNPVETGLSAVVSTRNLLEMLREQGKGRFLYLSSGEIYGKSEGHTEFREQDLGYIDHMNPRAAYPTGKRCAENLCVSYFDEYNVDCVIARPGHIYGPTMNYDDERASSIFPIQAASGQAIEMKSAGVQIRSYCYVWDAAVALLMIMMKGKVKEAYNISNPNSVVSIREMAEAFAKAAGVEIRFTNPFEAEKKGYNLMERSVLCSEKIEEIGFKGRYSMLEGAEHTIECLRYQRQERI